MQDANWDAEKSEKKQTQKVGFGGLETLKGRWLWNIWKEISGGVEAEVVFLSWGWLRSRNLTFPPENPSESAFQNQCL